MNTATIRRAKGDDYLPMLDITHRALHELARSHYSRDYLQEAIETGAWTLQRSLLDEHYFVAVDNDNILGGVGWNDAWLGDSEPPLDRRDDLGFLRGMFVSPEVARRGIGGLLLRHCIEDIRKAGRAGIELFASLNAEPVYAKYGFRECAIQHLVLASGASMPGIRMRLFF